MSHSGRYMLPGTQLYEDTCDGLIVAAHTLDVAFLVMALDRLADSRETLRHECEVQKVLLGKFKDARKKIQPPSR